MKVLFAVSNENISDSIVKKYQKDYKEIISYKNVYYFNAILKELQRDKTYDRIIISEDLEPFTNNDYEAIDRFIFDTLDSISDEATDHEGGDTPIILICSDRRAKSEQLLVKLFGIGIYSALLGQDRSIEEVCKLIRKPRTKKEAKIYYRIESEDVNYQAESEDTVSEVEIQNIRAHYKKLGKNEEAYVESFNNIASQYSDAQLRVIAKFLPLNVKAILERDSQKYQSIMTFGGEAPKTTPKKVEKKDDALKIDFIENQLSKQKLTKPVIVPSAVNTSNVKKLSKSAPIKEVSSNRISPKQISETQNQEPMVDLFDFEEEIPTVVETPKRGRGRPKKVVTSEEIVSKEEQPKKRRGRPRKTPISEEETPKRPIQSVNTLDLDEDEEIVETPKTTTLPGFDDIEDEREEMMDHKTILPGFDDVEDEEEIQQEPEPINTKQKEDVFHSQTNYEPNGYTTPSYSSNQFENTNEVIKSEVHSNINIENLLTRDKKIVSFVGTSKNGTSFLVNNLGEQLSLMGINTAILDMTKNKNSYFIYTKNEEELRRVAFNCMENLEKGIPEGIRVNKNLTVYTSLPSKPKEDKIEEILATLVKNYSLVLIDCDFHTPLEYLQNAQEIYLVQSMDILTIQPLTAFLRDLRAKNILDPEKIRIVINKETKIRSLNPKVIIGGMAFYNDPSMSFMTELFDKDHVKYTIIPFDEIVYSKYLEGLVNCKISLNGYSKNFMLALKELANMVYPLLNNKYKPFDTYDKKPAFSSKMNSTLEQMKRNY